MKIFASGSCRLLTTILDGRGKIEPIHSLIHNFVGVNFLGKLHNTKQHIQFIKWINDEIVIPNEILGVFLTSYFNGSREGMDSLELNPIKKQHIKCEYKNCDYYIFEVCSLKLYEKNGYQVQHELTNDYSCNIQSTDELYQDLSIIRKLVPEDKPILFKVHFRPNIIYQDESRLIEKREMIYHVVKKFCEDHTSTFLYDPSIILQKNTTLFDGDTHYTTNGYIESFEYMYNTYILK